MRFPANGNQRSKTNVYKFRRNGVRWRWKNKINKLYLQLRLITRCSLWLAVTMERYGNIKFVFHKGKAICERFEGICDAKYANTRYMRNTPYGMWPSVMHSMLMLIAAAWLHPHMRLIANCLLNFHHMCLSREPQQQQKEIVVYSFIVFMSRHLYPFERPLTFDTQNLRIVACRIGHSPNLHIRASADRWK